MENQHLFILTPSYWIGEGRISFSSSPDIVRFYTRWVLTESSERDGKTMRANHDVEMQGGQDQVKNKLIFYNFSPTSFEVELKNDLVGTILGNGLIDEEKIAWEFRGKTHFEGFEVYEKQDNGDYLFHAEYISQDHFRSVIDGRIWQKQEPLF